MKAMASTLAAVCSALAAWCLASSVPHLSAQTPDAKPIDDPESYAVYSALLPNRTMQGMHRRMIVLEAEAKTDAHGCWPSGPPIEGDWREALNSLQVENKAARTVLPGRDLSVPYVVQTKAAIAEIFGSPRDYTNPNQGWQQFYARYPDSAGYMALSAVGFSSDRTKAMVYVFHAYGTLGGEFSYHLLQKLDGRWQETRVPGVNTCLMMS